MFWLWSERALSVALSGRTAAVCGGRYCTLDSVIGLAALGRETTSIQLLDWAPGPPPKFSKCRLGQGSAFCGH